MRIELRQNRNLRYKQRTKPNYGKKYYNANTSKRVKRKVTYLTRNIYSNKPIVLGNIQESGREGNNKKRNDKPKGRGITCYACGKTGYIARDCRLKNKVI